MTKLQTRRQFIRNTGYVAMGIAFMGCGSEDSDPPADDETPDDGSTNNQAPVWSTIPAQTWTVGVPVYLDLNDYVTDADGDALTISLDSALPNGVTINDGVISGTPSTATASTSYAATADDGNA
ncbi:MAG: hypothetical protein B6D78_13585 [gamma proteobacterium symbiont of Ctena orbiculata]|nr:MAG: hypothetical protein B6D78_13585 [gamma proteobacterium symbiont of Ctena orbiculata]PVV27837.1 MAG: hypothetical protein B6D79_00320 [gamma proteobacterium symbiont of Ctena orbiculata]